MENASEDELLKLPKTRAEAIALGVNKYFTGKPCRLGHIGPRYSGDRQCVECMRTRDTRRMKERGTEAYRSAQLGRYEAYRLSRMADEGTEAYRLRQADNAKSRHLEQMAEKGTEVYRKNKAALRMQGYFQRTGEEDTEAYRAFEAERKETSRQRRIVEEGTEAYNDKLREHRRNRRAKHMEEVGTEAYRAENRKYAAEMRKHTMAEVGTEAYFQAQADKRRALYHRNADREREYRKNRAAARRNPNQLRQDRTPPWLTDDERAAIKTFYANCPPDMVIDHVVPFLHPKVAGLHVLANLQYLTPRQNNRKGNRLDCTEDEMAEYVRQGVAVWTKDVGEDGRVDWLWYCPAIPEAAQLLERYEASIGRA